MAMAVGGRAVGGRAVTRAGKLTLLQRCLAWHEIEVDPPAPRPGELPWETSERRAGICERAPEATRMALQRTMGLRTMGLRTTARPPPPPPASAACSASNPSSEAVADDDEWCFAAWPRKAVEGCGRLAGNPAGHASPSTQAEYATQAAPRQGCVSLALVSTRSIQSGPGRGRPPSSRTTTGGCTQKPPSSTAGAGTGTLRWGCAGLP